MTIKRIEDALTKLGAEHEPPRGWEDRVLCHVVPPPKRVPVWPSICVAVALAMVAVYGITKPQPVRIDISVQHGPTVWRGQSIHTGDRVRVTASGGSHGMPRIWAFMDERLIGSCPGNPECYVSSDGVSMSFVVSAIGVYDFMAVSSDRAMDPAQDFDSSGADVASEPERNRASARFQVR